jgi:hypothetical protein
LRQEVVYNLCMEKSERGEVRLAVSQKMEAVKDAIAGRYSDELPDEDSHDSSEVFEGFLLDLNDPTTTDQEIALVRGTMEKDLGMEYEDIPTTILRSADGLTIIKRFDIPLGQPDDEVKHFYAEQQNEGEKTTIIFWPDWMYDAQVEEFGYEEL